MKKILGLTIVALMVLGLVGGGTWAYFSDVATTTGNTFAAGTLDLGLSSNTSNTSSTGSTSATWTTPSNWAPGDNVSGTLYVNNNGTIAMSSVNITFSHGGVTDNTPHTVSSWNGTTDNDNLLKMLKATTVSWNGTTDATLEGDTLEQLVSASPHNLGSLPANTEYPLYIVFTFDPIATNGCQADTVDITVTLNGYQ